MCLSCSVTLSSSLWYFLVLCFLANAKANATEFFFLTSLKYFPNSGCVTFTRTPCISQRFKHVRATDMHTWIRDEERLGWKVSKGVGKTAVLSVLTSGLMKFVLACLTSHHQGTSSAPCWWEFWPAATALPQEISVRVCERQLASQTVWFSVKEGKHVRVMWVVFFPKACYCICVCECAPPPIPLPSAL